MRSTLCELGENIFAEDGYEVRRHARDGSAALRRYCMQRPNGFKALAGEHHGGTLGQARQDSHHHAEAVVERNRDADAILWPDPGRHTHLQAVVEQVVVGQGHAFRQSRSAAGKLDVDRVVEVRLESRQALEPGWPATGDDLPVTEAGATQRVVKYDQATQFRETLAGDWLATADQLWN